VCQHYRTDGGHRRSFIEFFLEFCGGRHTLLIRLIGSLTGRKAVNGYRNSSLLREWNSVWEMLRGIPFAQLYHRPYVVMFLARYIQLLIGFRGDYFGVLSQIDCWSEGTFKTQVPDHVWRRLEGK